MDHVVYLDSNAKEFDKLFRGSKNLIIRGATGPKAPYGKVNEGDILYFSNDDAEGAVKAKGLVGQVILSPRMEKEASIEMVELHKEGLRLSATQYRRWAGKRFLMIVEVLNFERIDTFIVDKSGYREKDDWLLVGDIHNVKML